MNDDDLLRYSRQLLLPEIDVNGQTRLAESRVALVGLGGLGSPAALYLAAAGVGTLHLLDDDLVALTNLQRQVLYRSADEGQAKTTAAANTLRSLNPGPRLIEHPHRLTGEPLAALFAEVDLVLDGTDNFLSRNSINEAARAARTPWLFAAAIRWEGQLTAFDPRRRDSPCYRCLHPQPGDGEDRCAESGVAGPVVGTLGCLLATEAIKWLLALGTSPVGRLTHYDALQGEFHQFKLPRFPGCPACGDGEAGASA